MGLGPNIYANGMLRAPMMGGAGILPNDPKVFYFMGNAMALETRLDAMTPEELTLFVDANITVTGIQIKPSDMCCYCCTIIWGSIVLFPLCFICCGWWKKIVYPAFDIPVSVYSSLHKLIRAPNLRNLTLNVVDNCLDAEKLSMLYNMVSVSALRGLTFINSAGNYDFKGKEHSNFEMNVLQFRQLQGLMCDIRW